MDISLAAGSIVLALEHCGLSAVTRIGRVSAQTFFAIGSTFSLASLVSAFLLAAFVISIQRLRRRGRLSCRLLVKALRPRRAVHGASGKADLGFFFFNTFSAGGLISWGLLSQMQVSRWTSAALALGLGASAGHRISLGPIAAIAVALVMFVAYEFAYWVDHWLSHRVPCLWEIHKVHHTAEALSPLTNFRVHPLETLKFYNIAALFTGVAGGATIYALGLPFGVPLVKTDIGMIAFMFTLAHLQHSHVWISFRGIPGRILMSPAHHQVHHSTDERHFGRNLGAALAVWDWMFGTLYIPSARREPLVFGVAGENAQVHTVTGGLITPVVKALAVLTAGPSRASQTADYRQARAKV